MIATLPAPRHELSPAKRSLLEKRLRGIYRRNGCASRGPRTSSSAARRSHAGSTLIPLQPKGTRSPLVLIHGAGGGLLWGYTNLAKRLGSAQPVYAIEPRSISNWRELRSVEALAERYLPELRAVQPHGPYYIGGYCFGGLVAYELARQLWLRCESIACLLLLDAAAPNGIYDRLPWWKPSFTGNFLRNCYYWVEDFCRLDRQAQRTFLQRKIGVALRKVLRRAHTVPDRLDLEEYIDTAQFPPEELELWQIHLKAYEDYRPRPYPGAVNLIRTRGQPLFCSFDPHFGWGELAAGGVSVQIVPGAHENIFQPPDIDPLAHAVRHVLEQAWFNQKLLNL